MVTAIVLAGGKNRRLGRSKVLETVGARSLIERVVEQLRPITSQLLIVTSREQSDLLNVPEAEVIADLYPGKGPLGGLYTGLSVSRSAHNIVVACDMPFLNRDLLNYMVQVSGGFDLVIPRLNNMVEPLHAVYSKDCLATIEYFLERDRLSVFKLIDHLKVRYVEADELDKFDPDHISFFNINTQDDLDRAREMAPGADGRLPRKHAVTAFLKSENEILILLRSNRVGTYPGKWGGISGSIDNGRTADEQASVEIEEETGIPEAQVELVKRGNPLWIADETLGIMKIVHPYLFRVNDRSQIKINWEHDGIKWIKPEDINDYETMPKLKETLVEVLS